MQDHSTCQYKVEEVMAQILFAEEALIQRVGLNVKDELYVPILTDFDSNYY